MNEKPTSEVSIDTPEFRKLLAKLARAAPGHSYVLARDEIIAYIDSRAAQLVDEAISALAAVQQEPNHE